MNDIEKAIETLRDTKVLCGFTDIKKWNKAIVLAINALQEKQERDKGCEYCKDAKDFIDVEGFRVWVDTDQPFLCSEHYIDNTTYSGTSYNKKINYCPMCGRKLGEKNGSC